MNFIKFAAKFLLKTLIVIIIAIICLLVIVTGSAAPPPGYNPNSPQAKYFRSLMQPDSPPDYKISCCDESDCRAAKVKFENNRWYAFVNEIEDYVEIPVNKIIEDNPHPSGSAVVCWMGYVLCFVPPGTGG